MWGHFTKLEVKRGKQLVKCNYCDKNFTCSSKGGTTHFLRHIDNGLCTSYNERGGTQSELSFKKDSSVEGSNLVPWKFDQESIRMDLRKLIIWHDLPFSFVEDPKFKKFVGGLCLKNLSLSQEKP